MARIGSLLVNLLLEDASFINGLKRATKQHEQSMRSMQRAADLAIVGMKTLGAVAGSVFSVQAIQGALDYAGSIGEISDALGVTTKELQVYRFAATQANLSNEEIEKGLAKATLEIGRNNDAFAKLGISTKTASGEIKTAGQILPELADALQKIESPAERSALLVELFGRQGQKLGPLLQGGAAGLKAFADEAERTGQVLSSKAIADADKAADNIAKLQNALRVSVAGAVAENSAAIAALSESLTGLIGRIGDLLRRASEANRIRATLGAARGDKSYLGGLLIARGKGDADPAAFQAALFSTALEDAAALAPGRGSAGAILPAPSGAAGGTGRVRAAAQQAAKEVSDAMKRLEQSAGGGGVLEGAFKPLDETAERLREIQQIAVDIPPIQPINLEALQLAEDFQRNLVDGLGQAIVFGRSLGDALVASIRAAAAQLITSGLLKLLQGGGDGSGGFIASAISSIGAAFGGARANGGPVSAGRAYLVGERGPEILFPGMSGTIASNRQSFGGTVVNVDARGATDPAAVERAAFTAFIAARDYTNRAFDQRARPQLARGAGA